MALYSGVGPPHSLEVTCVAQPSRQSKEHSSAFNELHRIAASQVIDLQLTDTQSSSRAQYLCKSVWTLQHPSVPAGTLKCRPWVRPHHRRMKGPHVGPRGIAFIELHFGIQPLPCLTGLKEKPHETQYCLCSDDRAKSLIHNESL